MKKCFVSYLSEVYLLLNKKTFGKDPIIIRIS